MSPWVQVSDWSLGDRRELYRKLRKAAAITTPERVMAMCHGFIGQHAIREMMEAAK